jgi:hypothetical protein
VKRTGPLPICSRDRKIRSSSTHSCAAGQAQTGDEFQQRTQKPAERTRSSWRPSVAQTRERKRKLNGEKAVALDSADDQYELQRVNSRPRNNNSFSAMMPRPTTGNQDFGIGPVAMSQNRTKTEKQAPAKAGFHRCKTPTESDAGSGNQDRGLKTRAWRPAVDEARRDFRLRKENCFVATEIEKRIWPKQNGDESRNTD